MAAKIAINIMSQESKSANTRTVDQNQPLWQWIIPPALLAFLTFMLYAPSLHYDFKFDDLANILKFFEIRHRALKDIFFTGPRWISAWLNTFYYKIGKFDPFAYRLGNVLFHATTSILIFYFIFILLKKFKQNRFASGNAFYIAFATAALFALHPVQTQTVSYVIQGQLEGLAGLFTISMLLCFIGYCYSSKIALQSFCFISLFVLAILGCGTKEIVIIAPALLLLVDWFFVSQGSWKKLKSRLLLHSSFAFTIFSIYFYFLKPQFFSNLIGFKMVAQNNIGNVLTQNQTDPITPIAYCISQFKVILHYLWIFIWPANISADYDWKLVKGFFDIDCIVPFLILSGFGYIIFKRLKTNSIDLISFGALWFFITILPRSSIIPSSELLADYKTYVASIGLLFVFAYATIYILDLLLNFMQERDIFILNENTLCLILFFLTIPLGMAAYMRNRVWSTAESFWHNIVKNSPGRARGYNNYGVALTEQQRYQEAIIQYEKAIELDGKYPDPWNNIAVVYSAINNMDKAIYCMEQSLKINPLQPEGHNNLGSFYLEKKMYHEAESQLKQAIVLRPVYGKAFWNIGRLKLAQNKKEEAYEAMKKCCTQADFDNAIGFSSYGNIAMLLEKYDEAIFAYIKALEYEPNSPNSLFSLGNCYLLTHQYEKAIPLYQNLLSVAGGDPRLLFNLGECYDKVNRTSEALDMYQHIERSNMAFPEVYIRIARALEKLGRISEAKDTLNKLLAKNPPAELRNLINNSLQHLDKIQ